MFEIKVLLRHPSALIPRTEDNKGSSIRSVDLDDIDLVNLDDPEVEFVHAVTASGRVKFLPAV